MGNDLILKLTIEMVDYQVVLQAHINTTMQNDKVKLIEQLLVLVSQDRQFSNAGHRLLYERGYLTGVLAALMADDQYAETYIQRRIQQLDKK